MVQFDWMVGAVVSALEEQGFSENTIVVVSSDNGPVYDDGYEDGSTVRKSSKEVDQGHDASGPYRGGKYQIYEGGTRVPFIVKWPGVTEAGSRDQHLVQNIDYAPTFLEIAGAAIPDDIQGESLVPLLKGESPGDWRTSIYYHYYEFPSVHMVPRHYGIRTERYKLMHFYQFGDEWELYDLEKDPDEITNIYNKGRNAGLIEELKDQLRGLQEYYQDDSDISEKPAAWQREQRGG